MQLCWGSYLFILFWAVYKNVLRWLLNANLDQILARYGKMSFSKWMGFCWIEAKFGNNREERRKKLSNANSKTSQLFYTIYIRNIFSHSDTPINNILPMLLKTQFQINSKLYKKVWKKHNWLVRTNHCLSINVSNSR